MEGRTMVEAEMSINIFDAIVYFVMFIAGAISLYRGFIKEFISLITWVGGAWITFALAPKSTAYMSQYISSPTGAAIVGVMGTYFVVVVTLGILGKILLRYIKKGADVGWFDNVMGLGLGVIKGGAVVVFAFIMITLIYKDEETYPEWLANASTVPVIQKVAAQVVRVSPQGLNTVSPLQQPTPEEIATMEGNPPQPNVQTIDTGLQQELQYQQEVQQQAPATQTGSPLEQLIMDVTKDKR
jgi:membrane protein required for colicin V production